MNFHCLFDKHISLGYNCFLKKYFTTVNELNQETQVFDYTGICVWAINELIENKFHNLFDREQYKNLQINKEGDKFIITNLQYYIIFKHDFKQDYSGKTLPLTDDRFNLFKEKYTRRIERFYTMLETKKSILFYRFGENLQTRVIHPQYKRKFAVPEYQQLIAFKKLINKLYPSLEIFIIYISKKHKTNFDKENRIITIFDHLNIVNYHTCEKQFDILLRKYQTKIQKFIVKIRLDEFFSSRI